MPRFRLALLVAALSAARGQTSLAYLNSGPGAHGCCVAIDGAGNSYVVSYSPTALFIDKLDTSLHQIYGYMLDVNGIVPAAVAVDAQGDVFVAGETQANGFPSIHPIAGSTPGLRNGFVIKLNPAGNLLLLASYFLSQVNGLALDPAGNVYVAGYQNVPCAATPGAFQSPYGGYCGVVAKLTNSGALVYQSVFPAVPVGIAASGDGSATFVGATVTPGYPTTPGAYQTVCECNGTDDIDSFVTRLSPDGSTLVWSTLLGGSAGAVVTAIALAPDGGVVLAGEASPSLATPGAFIGPNPAVAYIGVAKLNSTGTALLFLSAIGNTPPATAVQAGLQVDAAGHIWLAGQAGSDFPVLPNSVVLGTRPFVLEMSADGSSLLSTQFPPNYAADAVALDAAGFEVLIGENGSVLRYPVSGPTGPAILGEGNAEPAIQTGYTVSGVVSPGGIVTLYGVGLGPTQGVGAQFDATGRVATELAGTQVLFDGVAAPLLYVSAQQINVVVPFGAGGETLATTMGVHTSTGVANPVRLTVAPADPAILAVPDPFTGMYRSLIVNQEGSVNTPAQPGSMVTFWATGVGPFTPALADGSIVEPPLAAPLLPVSVSLTEGPFADALPCQVLFSGAAPGLLAGILQVNVRLPFQITPGSQNSPYNGLVLTVGGRSYFGTVAVALQRYP